MEKLTSTVAAFLALGKALHAFLAVRAYLTIAQFWAAAELLFPLGATCLTPEELLTKFKEGFEYAVKAETFEQYSIHIRAFFKFIGNKPIYLVTPQDVTSFVRLNTVTKTRKGDKVVQSTHDHKIDVLRNFFTFLVNHGYYPRILGNPVQARRIGNKRRTPKESTIFTAGQFQELLSAVPWFCIPAMVCLFILGVRPGTLMRLEWEDFDWQRRVLKINRKKNKCGAAGPYLTDQVLFLLAPWRDCSGPIIVRKDTLQVIRTIARKLGIREEFSDDARKTAISMRAAFLYAANPSSTESMLDREFGNSKEVREIFYFIMRERIEADAYYACTLTFGDILISSKEARAFRRCQISSAGRVAYAMAEVTYQITHTTDKDIIMALIRKAERDAIVALPPLSSFPSIVKIDQDSDLIERERKRKTLGEQAAVLEALNEQYGNEEKQLSIFEGRGDLFIAAKPTEDKPAEVNPADVKPSQTKLGKRKSAKVKVAKRKTGKGKSISGECPQTPDSSSPKK